MKPSFPALRGAEGGLVVAPAEKASFLGSSLLKIKAGAPARLVDLGSDGRS